VGLEDSPDPQEASSNCSSNEGISTDQDKETQMDHVSKLRDGLQQQKQENLPRRKLQVKSDYCQVQRTLQKIECLSETPGVNNGQYAFNAQTPPTNALLA
jgi:hypothetical protein